MSERLYTRWERWVDGEGWVHNHIEDGHVEELQLEPRPKHPSFTAQLSWANHVWRKFYERGKFTVNRGTFDKEKQLELGLNAMDALLPEERKVSLGAVSMPLGYSLIQLDSGHYMWVEDRTGRESEVDADRWAIYRSAVKDRIRAISCPDGGDVS